MADINSGPGWYEVINPRNATTCIAHVREDGTLYLPEGEDTLTPDEFTFAAARGNTHRLIRAEEAPTVTRRDTAVEERLARHLAATDYLVDGEAADDEWWASRLPKFREDYLAYAREVIGIVKGPTVAAQAIANLGAEIRELTRQRDRYRDAWRSAVRGRARLRSGRSS